jgi:hypothetical protein
MSYPAVCGQCSLELKVRFPRISTRKQTVPKQPTSNIPTQFRARSASAATTRITVRAVEAVRETAHPPADQG